MEPKDLEEMQKEATKLLKVITIVSHIPIKGPVIEDIDD